MTTPERIKRRQYKLGIAIAVLGILTVVWGIVLESQNIQQRHCLRDSLAQLNAALTVRANLSDERNSVIAQQNVVRDERVEVQSQLIHSVATTKTTEEFQHVFEVFEQADLQLVHRGALITLRLDKLNAEIKNTPLPEFPEGKCS